MTETILTRPSRRPSGSAMKRTITLAVTALAGLSGGCVNVSAPDKPIVINLNISVTQEVVYRLDGQAKNLIQANPGIF